MPESPVGSALVPTSSLPAAPTTDTGAPRGPGGPAEPGGSAGPEPGHEALGRALDALDGDARQALLLHYFAAMSFAQVAAQLQLPGPVVTARAARGLRQLGTALTGPGVRLG